MTVEPLPTLTSRNPLPVFALLMAASLFTGFVARAPAAEGLVRLPLGTVDATDVDLYVLTNANGMVAKVMNYGATLTELDTPDRDGKLDDVVLGFENLGGYLQKEPYFGAVVGRVGNRIAKGRFTLNGTTYQLATNDGPNHLHGGIKGFDKVVWDARVVSEGKNPAVEFAYRSRDGEEGYPGNCTVKVTYALSDTNELSLSYVVATDMDTPVNVTNHSYFNLAGAENGGVLDHVLQINADRYTPVDATLIPTGELRPVAGTPMDFRQPTRIGERIAQAGGNPVGYDHNYVLNSGGGSLALAATVFEPKSGRVMDVLTTEPGVQFYSGNFLDGTLTGKKGVIYRQYAALALETQHFPDSVNQPGFPSYVLKAGQTYTSQTVLRFSAR
jgi:aldose 1-epimerase